MALLYNLLLILLYLNVINIIRTTEFAEDSVIAGRLPAVTYEKEEKMSAAGTGSGGATLQPLHGGGRASYQITINNYAGNGKQSFS